MEINNCRKIIERRKSVRSYIQKEVREEDLMDILDCARLAPSAKNKQPWKYVILSNEKKEEVYNLFINKLKIDNVEESGLATSEIIKQASKLVLVFMKYRDLSEYECLTTQYLSVGASIENALLRATELKIGSLWIYDLVAIKDELEKMFAPDLQFVSSICFGYENENFFRAKKKELNEIVEIV